MSSLAELRGFSLFTTSERDFHGLLVVQDSAEILAWNRSTRRMTFDPILRPQALWPDPRGRCRP